MSKAYPKIIITIDTQNAAFGDTPEERLGEIMRILNQGSNGGCAILEVLEGSSPSTVLRDINGNTCGSVRAR